jgi:2-phosphoglycerate kinase
MVLEFATAREKTGGQAARQSRRGRDGAPPGLRSLPVPFTCEACGAGSDLIQIPAHGTVLRCPYCGHKRPFFRPPLLVVTGTSGVGKSTICIRLAGKIRAAVLLDCDVFASDMASVANEDYAAFWRSMGRLAHELSQNKLAVVLFSVMLPQQLLANTDVVDYFEVVSFLCLTCDADVLRARFAQRLGDGSESRRIEAAVDQWSQFNDALMDASRSINDVHTIDASRSIDEVERDVRDWILARLHGYS